MLAPLKKDHQEEQEFHDNTSPEFQEFQQFDSNSAKLKELVFFARIALFAISTVIVTFFLLVFNLVPIWAFLFASLISLAVTSTISTFIWSIKR